MVRHTLKWLDRRAIFCNIFDRKPLFRLGLTMSQSFILPIFRLKCFTMPVAYNYSSPSESPKVASRARQARNMVGLHAAPHWNKTTAWQLDVSTAPQDSAWPFILPLQEEPVSCITFTANYRYTLQICLMMPARAHSRTPQSQWQKKIQTKTSSNLCRSEGAIFLPITYAWLVTYSDLRIRIWQKTMTAFLTRTY